LKAISPKSLFDNIARFAEQFRGHQQQDAQELLRFLLDSIITNEVESKFLKRCEDSEIISPPEELISPSEIFKTIFQGSSFVRRCYLTP
jgi:ubiquitin C-terminal hydrolase